MEIETEDRQATTAPGRGLRKRIAALQAIVKPARPLRIADVGANPINTPEYTTLHELRGCEVWGFEPEPAAFARLEEAALPGAHFVQRAVGKPGKAQFYGHPQSGLGSLLKVDKAAVAYIGRPGWHERQFAAGEVDVVALDEVPEAELPCPDVLKIDIQGGELDVFQTGRAKLSQAIAVVTEVRFSPIYENEPLWGDLDRELRDQGFALHKLAFTKSFHVGSSMQRHMTKSRMRTQLVDGDAIYIRNPLRMADWSDDQIVHLAIAAVGVFDSIDLVFLCLDHLVERKRVPPEAPETFLAALPKWMRG